MGRGFIRQAGGALAVVTGLVAAGSVALALLPGAAEWLVYDRASVLGGQVWRLLTGHTVHLSVSHAAWNLVVFAVAGAWLERRDRARLGWLIGLTALASGLWFLAFMPAMARYGGLSGVVSAMVVYLSLIELRRNRAAGQAGAIWAAILLLFAAKIAYEIVTGQALFAGPGAAPFEVVPAAHLIGAGVAVALVILPPRRDSRRPPKIR